MIASEHRRATDGFSRLTASAWSHSAPRRRVRVHLDSIVEAEDGGGEEKRGDFFFLFFSALSVLRDNECFVRENPSTVTVGGGNVRKSYGLLAFNPRGPAPQSN